jgi:hypothetical protein
MNYAELVQALRASLVKEGVDRVVMLRGQRGALPVTSALVNSAIDEMEKQPQTGEMLSPLAQIGAMLLLESAGVKW